MKALVADDEPFVREEIAEFLELLGYEVRTAEDGRKALEGALSWVPDLVILDLVMPEMEGIELTGELRRRPRAIRPAGRIGQE